jgi:methyltransferase-like protein 6
MLDLTTMASGDSKLPLQTQRLQIYSKPNSGVSPFWRGISFFPTLLLLNEFLNKKFKSFCFLVAEKYEREAKRYWDVFYKRHKDKVSFFNSIILLDYH